MINILSSLRLGVSSAVLLAPSLLVAQAPAQTPAEPPPQAPAPLPDAPSAAAHTVAAAVPTGPVVLFDTTMGRLTCQLFTDEAPVTSANFVGLATGTKPWTDPATHQPMKNKPFYNGTQFHRVIPGFMIQGGDPLGNGMGDAGFYIPDEVSPALRFDVPGRLAMANGGPNTNSSQFFVTEVPKPELNGHYSIFGQCDPHSVLIVASIARVERNPDDKPYTPVLINKVTVLQPGQPVPPDPTPAAPLTIITNPEAPPSATPQSPHQP